MFPNPRKAKNMTKLLVTLGPSSLNKNTIQACDKKGIFLYFLAFLFEIQSHCRFLYQTDYY